MAGVKRLGLMACQSTGPICCDSVRPHRGPPMRNKAFVNAVRLARHLCMSQSYLSPIVWELVVAPASAGQSCSLAFDARRSGCAVSVGQLGGNLSDHFEMLRLDGNL